MFFLITWLLQHLNRFVISFNLLHFFKQTGETHINVKEYFRNDISLIFTRQRKPKLQLRMNNPRVHATLGTRDGSNKTRKITTMTNTDPTKKPGVNKCARQVQLLLISYKTPAMVLIIKSGKCFDRDRGKINRGKRHNIHCYLIFCSGHTLRQI